MREEVHGRESGSYVARSTKLTPQTAYTKEHPAHKQTWLCFSCCPKLGIDAYAKPKKPRKAPAAKKDGRAKIVHYDVIKGAPDLADLCIKVSLPC